MDSRRGFQSPAVFTNFGGVDRRRSIESSDPASAYYAIDLRLKPGGEYTTRGDWVPFAQLDTSSIGLYVVAGKLRSAVNLAGTVTLESQAAPRAPAGIIYDYIHTLGAGTDTQLSVTASSSWGVDGQGKPRSYIVTKATLPANSYQHHYTSAVATTKYSGTFTITSTGVVGANFPVSTTGGTIWVDNDATPHAVSASTATTLTLVTAWANATNTYTFTYISHATVSTRVALPFAPGPSLINIRSKLWAPAPLVNAVYYSSTLNGPSDWTLANDAGFINIGINSTGSAAAAALGVYQGQLAVLCPDAIQLWNPSATPANISLDRTISGLGTSQPRSVVNVAGDLYYMSTAGLRSLKLDAFSARPNDSGVGARVAPVSSALSGDALYPTMAVWHQPTNQLLVVPDSSSGYSGALSIIPEEDKTAWTLYSNGPSYFTDVVSTGGKLYARGVNNIVYVMDETIASGYWQYTSQFHDFGAPGKRKRILSVDVAMTGSASLSLLYNPTNLALGVRGPVITSSTLNRNRSMIPVSLVPSVAVQLFAYDTKPVTITTVLVYAETLGR